MLTVSGLQQFPARKKKIKVDGGIPFLGMALLGCLPSFLKRAYYRARGAVIGKNVSLGLFSFIQSPVIELADGARIAPFTFIRARTACRMGKRSSVCALTAIDTGLFEMAADSEVGEQVVIGGLLTPRSALRLGERCKIFSFSFINPTEPVDIGDDVSIGGGSYIFTHGTWPSMLDGFHGNFGPVVIGNGTWLGWRSFILPHVVIGEYSAIGAGAVVNRDVPAYSVAAGVPARIVKTTEEHVVPDDERKCAMLQHWLQEFADYMTYLGYPSVCSGSANGMKVTVSADRAGVIVFRARGSDIMGDKPDIVLSLNGISGEERQALAAKAVAWFDVAARESGIADTALCQQFRRFLTRYGLRFSVVCVI